MKRPCLSFLLLTLGSALAFSQENSPERKFEHQLGLNATQFVQNFLSFNGFSGPGTPYLFQYKGFYLLPEAEGEATQRAGLRLGFGRTSSSSNSEHPTAGLKTEFGNEFLDFRAGGEYQVSLGERWTFYGGIDYVYSKILFNTKSQSANGGQPFLSETKEFFESNGMGPVMGFQFNINKRLCMGTELSYYSTSGIRTRSTWTNSPWQPYQYEREERKNAFVIAPAFIFFNVRI